MYQLVVALGNPGSEYAQTKHNIGWMLFESMAELRGQNWKSKFKGLYCEASLSQHKAWFLMPQTYMNLSGESVQPMAAFFKITPDKILVVHDELDIPFGQVHFKMGGGLAGHNGLKSIAASLGTDQFARMRIGIGRPTVGSVSDWVLSGFSKEQSIAMPQLFEKLRDPFTQCVISGINKVANQWNKKPLV